MVVCREGWVPGHELGFLWELMEGCLKPLSIVSGVYGGRGTSELWRLHMGIDDGLCGAFKAP